MLTRWNPIINCINKALHTLRRLEKQIKLSKRGRGRKPKRSMIKYDF